jgi:hypothetical protein
MSGSHHHRLRVGAASAPRPGHEARAGQTGRVAALSPGRRRALLVARRAYAAVLLAVVAWVLVTRGDDVVDLVQGARPAVLLACLLAAYGQLALTSAVWTSGLRALGTDVPWATSLQATAESGPARYLPGSVWYALSRGVALQRTGVPVRALAAVATLETLLVPVIGFAVGGVLLAATGTAVGGALSVPVVLVAVALLALTTPPVVNRALRVRAGDGPPLRLSWPAQGRLVAWITVFWLWSGSVFALYVSAFPAATDSGPVTAVGAYMVAWGVGWLTVLAPQGLGVFEVVLAGLLAGGGAGLALVLAGYRALIVVRDLSRPASPCWSDGARRTAGPADQDPGPPRPRTSAHRRPAVAGVHQQVERAGQEGRHLVAAHQRLGVVPAVGRAARQAAAGRLVDPGLVRAAVVVAEEVRRARQRPRDPLGRPGEEGGHLRPAHALVRPVEPVGIAADDARGRQRVDGRLVDAAVVVGEGVAAGRQRAAGALDHPAQEGRHLGAGDRHGRLVAAVGRGDAPPEDAVDAGRVQRPRRDVRQPAGGDPALRAGVEQVAGQRRRRAGHLAPGDRAGDPDRAGRAADGGAGRTGHLDVDPVAAVGHPRDVPAEHVGAGRWVIGVLPLMRRRSVPASSVDA